jgi:hypothetical protein
MNLNRDVVEKNALPSSALWCALFNKKNYCVLAKFEIDNFWMHVVREIENWEKVKNIFRIFQKQLFLEKHLPEVLYISRKKQSTRERFLVFSKEQTTGSLPISLSQILSFERKRTFFEGGLNLILIIYLWMCMCRTIRNISKIN